MSCASYRAAISHYLDDALSESERRHLLAHIQSCSQCAATLAEYRTLETVLRRARQIRAPSFSHSWLSASPPGTHHLPIFRFFPMASLGVTQACAVLAILLLFLGGSLALFAPRVHTGLSPALALTAIEPSFRAGQEDTNTRTAIYANSEATAARGAPRTNPDEMKVKPSRPFALGYRPAGQPVGVPIYTSPSADLAVVYAALGDSLTRPSAPLDLSGTLPPTALVDRVTIERAPAPSQAYYLEIVFSLPSGTRYRLQEITADASLAGTTAVAEEGTLLIAGRAWKYGYVVPRDLHDEPVHVLRSASGNRITNLEAAAPLDEMVQILEYLR